MLFFHGARAGFSKFKRDFITLAKQHGVFQAFNNEVEIPGPDEDKSVDAIQAIGFADGEVRKHFLALKIPSRAIKSKTDNDIFRRVTSPTAAWRVLLSSNRVTTRGVKLQHMKALTSRGVKPVFNPMNNFPEMDADVRDLQATGINIPTEIVYLLFLEVLQEVYYVFGHMPEREKGPPAISGFNDELRARYDLSKKVRSRSSDTALVASIRDEGTRAS